ncbi:MAG: tetratricopeptide repeat protein [Clostridia bacterium]|nr:tetratricopeptide repeat protein [Deltaproteobacteria bacterium]
MINSYVTHTRWAAVGLLACFTAIAGIQMLGAQDAHAQTSRKAQAAKAKKSKEPKRADIKRESKLSEKKDTVFDAAAAKTEALKVDVEDTKAPTALTPEETKAASMQAMVDEKLEEEISLGNQVLKFDTKCDEAAPVRFNVADLYWEQSKRAFYKSQDFNTPEKDRKRWEDRQKSLEQKTVDNYKWIIDECSGYADYSKTLFYTGRALMEMDQPQEGVTYLTRIIKEYPDSQWVPNAWLMIGEYYFDTQKDVQKALASYKKAAKYTDSPVYGYAVYWQGWCYINTGDWDLALERFRDVITISDDSSQSLDGKGRVALRKEGIKDYVRAYANIGDAKAAYATFLKVGGKKSVQDMMERLGNWYISQGSHRNVIVVYRDLIKNYPRSTRLPIFQGRIVDASSRLGDPKATVAQAKLLTEYFHNVRDRKNQGDLSEDEKKTITKDLKEAEEIAENTLRRLAMEYHADAKKLRGVAQERNYQLAHDLYAHYLDVFPEPIPGSDVNYVFFMRFYYAEVLYKLEKFQEAAKNYDAVVLMNPTPTEEREKKIVLAAAEEAVRSYDQLVQDLDRNNPPEISGTEPKPIPQVKQDLITACQRYIQYVGDSGEEIVAIRYKMARIYYTYNHFDEAAPAFTDIVTNHPENEVACYSANLALDIYNGQKNFRALKQAAGSFRNNQKLACGDTEREKFARIEEQSTFQLIKSEYEDKKNYLTAAKAYMQFFEKFPTSEFADDAVYNASVDYDLGNRLDQANQTRQFLIAKLPNSPLVPETMYNVAQSYERIVDFQDAATYLELFASKYPTDRRSKDALYNAGIYRATLGDVAGSKKDREAFIKTYKDDEEVPNVAFSICESYENQARQMETRNGGKPTQASNKVWLDTHDCYFAYIRNGSYARQNLDHLCIAQFRRGEVMRKVNNKTGAEETDAFVLRGWPGWQRQVGKAELPLCADAVAQLQFQKLEPDLKEYKQMRISMLNPTDAGVKKFQASVGDKVRARDKLVKQYTEIVTTGVAEWGLASLFEIGELYRDSVDKLLNAPIPSSISGQTLTEEQKGLLRNQLRDQYAKPVEEQAVDAYRFCVQKANELGVYNKWSVRALNELQKLRPIEYQPVTERLVKVEFNDRTPVARNGAMLPDGDSYKRVNVVMTGGTIPGTEAPAAQIAPQSAPMATSDSTKSDSTKSDSTKSDSTKSDSAKAESVAADANEAGSKSGGKAAKSKGKRRGAGR